MELSCFGVDNKGNRCCCKLLYIAFLDKGFSVQSVDDAVGISTAGFESPEIKADATATSIIFGGFFASAARHVFSGAGRAGSLRARRFFWSGLSTRTVPPFFMRLRAQGRGRTPQEVAMKTQAHMEESPVSQFRKQAKRKQP